MTDLTQRWRVEGLVERAIASQEQDGRYSAEQRAWMDRGPTDGIPSAALTGVSVTPPGFGRVSPNGRRRRPTARSRGQMD